MNARPHPSLFRQRLMRNELLLGTFVKTPGSHTTELVGSLGFDFVVIDEEHAPFDRATIDQALLGARASGTAGIVRVAETSRAKILSVLDDGATGIMAPHMDSVEKAREVVAACRYRGGKRGYSNTNRGGSFGGTPMWTHIDERDAETTLIAMIEDVEALDVIDDILAVTGLDAVFIGRGDLTAVYGAKDYSDSRVQSATNRVVEAARKVGKPACLLVSGAEEATHWRSVGVHTFLVSSDQGFLRSAALKTRVEFDSMTLATTRSS